MAGITRPPVRVHRLGVAGQEHRVVARHVQVPVLPVVHRRRVQVPPVVPLEGGVPGDAGQVLAGQDLDVERPQQVAGQLLAVVPPDMPAHRRLGPPPAARRRLGQLPGQPRDLLPGQPGLVQQHHPYPLRCLGGLLGQRLQHPHHRARGDVPAADAIQPWVREDRVGVVGSATG